MNKNWPVESIWMNLENTEPLLDTFRSIADELDLLHVLLQQESQALEARHVEEIAAITIKKQTSVDRIRRQMALQNRFFESRRIPEGLAGLESFLKGFDKEDPGLAELRRYQEKINDSVERCKALNERNGACIELLNRHTRRALDLLQNAGNSDRTYGPDGTTRNLPRSRQRISV